MMKVLRVRDRITNEFINKEMEFEEVLQMLNNVVELTAKLPSMKPTKLGIFRVSKVIIDGDGESILCFNSLNDYVEMNNVNSIVCNEEFQILMRAEIEEEENEEE